MANVKLVCTLVLCMLVTAPMAHAIQCGQVAAYLAPCIQYVMGDGKDAVPKPCCAGVTSLNDAANNTAERQQTCQCLKIGANQISGINENVAGGIPEKCGLKIPYKISTSTDCASIK